NTNLTNEEEVKFQSTLDGLYYTYRSQLLPEDHELSDQISVRLNLTCDSPIEATYFSCRLKKFDVCYWCGESESLIELLDILKMNRKLYIHYVDFAKIMEKHSIKEHKKIYFIK
ncbi:5440_t:CDS:1, partial [Gigaspora rosea]